MPDSAIGGLVGRNDELSVLTDTERYPGHVYVYGSVGSGKTALLNAAVERLTRSDPALTVLSARFPAFQSNEAFGGLYQIVEPILRQRVLAPSVRDLVESTFSAPSTREQAGSEREAAFAALFASAIAAAPLLLVLDDFHYIDRDSRRIITAVQRQLATSERLRVIAAGADDGALAAATGCFRMLALAPLSMADSARILDRLPDPPQGLARQLTLAQAEGNVGALLAIASTTVPQPPFSPESASSTTPGAGAWIPNLASLPSETRRFLLHVALAETRLSIRAIAAAMDTPQSTDLWRPAELMGLVKVAADIVVFAHPTLRPAVVADSSSTERLAAHRNLARAYPRRSIESLLHLAAATPGPDDTVAAQLLFAAEAAEERGGYADAARAYAAGTTLASDDVQRTNAAVRAMTCAQRSGDASLIDRTHEIYERELHMLTSSEDVAIAIAKRHGEHLQQRRAIDVLRRFDESEAEKPGPRSPDFVVTAARIAFDSGRPSDFAFARDLLHRAVVNGHGIRAGSIEWEWVSLVTGVPSTEPVETEARPTVETLLLNAKAVSLRANPLRACELFEQILFRVDPSQATGVIRESAVPYALALLEVGRFDDAESWLRDTLDIAVVAASPRLELQTAAILAKLLADRDHPQEATRVLDGALHRQMQVDLTDNAFTDLLLASARSAICAAEDDLDTAYFIAAQGFGPEGRSRHYIANQLALPELLAPGVRLGHESELSRLVEAACRTWMARGLTVSALFEHALAVSMATDDPEELFRSSISRALATSRLTRAAFARADYGAWLRRQRRAGEAREVLQAAREFFVKAGLRRPASWVEMELRAAGDVSAAAHVEAILAPLTPQQQQIVRLAAAGLRNEQIAKQMYLSTHTVRSHLYRVFPKLGVNSRQQLRELLHGSSSAADGDTQARTG